MDAQVQGARIVKLVGAGLSQFRELMNVCGGVEEMDILMTMGYAMVS